MTDEKFERALYLKRNIDQLTEVIDAARKEGGLLLKVDRTTCTDNPTNFQYECGSVFLVKILELAKKELALYQKEFEAI